MLARQLKIHLLTEKKMKKRVRRGTREPVGAQTNPASRSFRIADYPFYRIARVAGLYTACLDHELKPRGMDQPHWRVLMILSEHNPASMGLIAKLAVMKLPTVVRLVQRMTEEGLVRNAPRASDQRVMEVRITPQGLRALVVVKRVAAEVYAHAIKGLALSEVEQMNDLLGRVEGNLETTRRERKGRAASRAA